MSATSPTPISHLFFSFLRLGATAFGGPAMVAYIREMAVERKRWLDGRTFDDGVALCQAIPGATAMQTAAYVGLCARGVLGAAASFVGFGLPAFVLMMAFSVLYARTHELPVVVSVFSGLRAIIVALVANATVSFGKTSLKHWQHMFIAALAACLFGGQVNPIGAIILSSLLGFWLIPRSPPHSQHPGAVPLPHNGKAVSVILSATVLGLIGLFLWERQLFDLTVAMCRIDLFAFGGGFASVPLMFHQFVEVHPLLDGPTLLNGIVLGQITPGPIVITATFVGYAVAGPLGGVMATVGIFSPSFLMVIAIAPYFDRLRATAAFNKIIAGVLCSFVGLLLTVTIRFGQDVTWDLPHLILAATAFISLRLKVNILWVVLIGGMFSALFCR